MKEFVQRVWRHQLKDMWEGLVWLTLTLIFGLMPLWGGILATVYFGEWKGPAAFLQNGEGFIYAAPLIGGVIYVVTKTVKKRTFQIFAILLLLFNTFIYAIELGQRVVGVQEQPTDSVLSVSVSTLVVSCFLAYWVKVLECKRIQPAMMQKDQDAALEEDFERLGG